MHSSGPLPQSGRRGASQKTISRPDPRRVRCAPHLSLSCPADQSGQLPKSHYALYSGSFTLLRFHLPAVTKDASLFRGWSQRSATGAVTCRSALSSMASRQTSTHSKPRPSTASTARPSSAVSGGPTRPATEEQLSRVRILAAQSTKFSNTERYYSLHYFAPAFSPPCSKMGDPLCEELPLDVSPDPRGAGRPCFQFSSLLRRCKNEWTRELQSWLSPGSSISVTPRGSRRCSARSPISRGSVPSTTSWTRCASACRSNHSRSRSRT